MPGAANPVSVHYLYPRNSRRRKTVKGFCYAATLDEVRANGYVLTPGRYVGAEDLEDDGIPFEEKMRELTGTLAGQFAESARLETLIREKLKEVGYEF